MTTPGMRSLLLTLALGCLVTLLAAPVGARAAAGRTPALALRPTTISGADRVLSDGEHQLGLVHWASYDGRSSVTVVDVTGAARERTLVAPRPGCAAVQLRPTELLWSCQPVAPNDPYAYEGIVADVATGATTPLPSIADLGDIGYTYDEFTALGARWGEVTRTGYHFTVRVYVDRVTGAVAIPPSDLLRTDVDFDLDGATLVRPLCATVRRPLVADAFMGLEPGPITHRDGWWAGAGRDAEGAPDAFTLQRCGRSRVVLSRERPRLVPTRGPVLGDGFVAWTEAGREPVTGDYVASVLAVRRLEGRRVGPVRRLELPTPVTPIAVGSRLYLEDSVGAIDRVRLR